MKTEMSANLGRRLYAHLWDSASPFLGRVRANRVAAPDASSRRVLDPGSGSRRLSTPFRKGSTLTRPCASGGSLLISIFPGLIATETGTACNVPTRIAAHHVWKRALHTTNDNLQQKGSSGDNTPSKDDDSPQSVRKSDKTPSHDSRDLPASTPPNRHLMDRLPPMPHLHRPTKEELLAAATGFWSRLKVRFKWFSIRSVRPFNLDEITALFSWVLLGHVVWVVVGTTTFFSLLILAINTVFAQGTYIGPSNVSLC